MADKDLAFLHECSNDELDVLVKIIKSRITETLTGNEAYEKYAPNHKMYVDVIEQELIDFGTTGGGLKNTLFGNKPYREIVRDVCKELGAPAYQNASTSILENALLETVLFKIWDDLDGTGRRTLAKGLGKEAQKIFKRNGLSYDSLRKIFRKGRRSSYKLFAFLANSVAQKYARRNLKIAKDLGQTLAIGLFSAPLAMIFAGHKVLGPAYAVTSPAAIYIAALRWMKEFDPFIGRFEFPYYDDDDDDDE